MKPLLEIRNLTKFYSKKDKLPAVCDISLEITKNSSLALIGESGCGKTTILNIIVAILNADERTLFDINFKNNFISLTFCDIILNIN